MGAIGDAFDTAFRDHVTEGVPSSGDHEPVKSEIRDAGRITDEAVAAVGLAVLANGGTAKETRALLEGDLAYDAGTFGIVYADATAANNGMYVKTGASGAGAWTATGLSLVGVTLPPASTLEAIAGVATNRSMTPASTRAALMAQLAGVSILLGDTVGRPGTDAMAGGTTNAGSGTYAFYEPVRYKGRITKIEWVSGSSIGAPGTLKIRRFTQDAATQTYTQVGDDTPVVPNSSTLSLQTYTPETPIEFEAGEHLGFYTPANSLRVQTAEGDEGGYLRLATTDAATFQDNTPFWGTQLKIRFTVEYYLADVLDRRVDVLEDRLARQTQETNFGKPAGEAFVAGANLAAGTWVYSEPAVAGGVIREFNWLQGGGTATSYILFRRFRRDADGVTTQVGVDFPLPQRAAATEHTYTPPEPIRFEEGDFFGFVTLAAGTLYAVTAYDRAYEGGVYYSAGDVTEFTDTSANHDLQIQFRMTLEYDWEARMEQRVSALEAPMPEITAERAMAVEADTTTVHYRKNAQSAGITASLIKVFNALVARDLFANLDDTFTFDASDMDGGAGIGFVATQTITFRNGHRALMKVSDNETANAFGRLGGTILLTAEGNPPVDDPDLNAPGAMTAAQKARVRYAAAMQAKGVELGCTTLTVATVTGFGNGNLCSMEDMLRAYNEYIRDADNRNAWNGDIVDVEILAGTDAGTFKTLVHTSNILVEQVPGYIGGKTGWINDDSLFGSVHAYQPPNQPEANVLLVGVMQSATDDDRYDDTDAIVEKAKHRIGYAPLNPPFVA